MISYFDFRTWILLAMCSLLSPVGIIQQQSREEAIREAGRLGTEAEQIRGEAYKEDTGGWGP